MAPLAFTRENFGRLREQLTSVVKANTALAKEKAKLKKERDELRSLVAEMKDKLHAEVLGGSEKLEKLALVQIKKWVGKAIKVLDRIF